MSSIWTSRPLRFSPMASARACIVVWTVISIATSIRDGGGWGLRLTDDGSTTGVLLTRWHDGDRTARDALLDRHLPWLREQVHRQLGAALRSRAETGDFVHEVVSEFLEYAPKFRVTDEKAFRALLMRIVETTLQDQSDWYRAKRRDFARSVPLPTDTVLGLDPPRHQPPTPSQIASTNEETSWARLALELLDAEDRRLVVMREIDGSTFREIAAALAISDDAAERRYRKAFERLGFRIKALKRGDVSSAASDGSE